MPLATWMSPKNLLGIFSVIAYLTCIIFENWRPHEKSAVGKRSRVLDATAVLAVILFSVLMSDVLLTSWGYVLAWGDVISENLALSVAKVGAVVLLVDFALYWTHRLMHTRWLWRSHVLHHSPTRVDWLSGYRASFVHIVLYNSVPLLIVSFLIPLHGWELFGYFAVATLFQLFAHLNVKTRFPLLENIIVTPAYHRLHHSQEHRGGRNYTNVLVIWDRIFGTYVDPAVAPQEFKTGVAGYEIQLRSFFGF